MAATLQVLFECQPLPRPGSPLATVQRLGIQKGKEVIEDVLLEGRTEIKFQFSIQVEIEPASETVFFRGKYVQGPRSDPFIYLCWGDRAASAGSEETWIQYGRAKIPLRAIPNQQIQKALQTGSQLHARISLTDGRGNPACATLKTDHVEWVDTVYPIG